MMEYLNRLIKGGELSFEDARGLVDTILNGEVPPGQVAAFLTAMRIKGASPAEIAGFASSLREHAVRVETGLDNMVDTCGTGGAKLKTFNISTASAFVAAGAGVYVAKHGNKGITSKCGSADVLEALGVNLDPGPEKVAECIKQARIGFMFAPKFHPAMKYVQPVRKELGFRTVFNILGPLANPAHASAQVMGVADESLMPMIVETLKIIGIKRAMVVHSDGLDEISTMGVTKVMQLKDGNITESTISPVEIGMEIADFNSLKGSDAQGNAGIIRDILAGKETGAKKDIVILNAAAAIIVAGLAENFNEAIKIADESVTSGKAGTALKMLVEISNS
ncbi:MAG: anthranilate phosphoribosyltransferase [Planctomycetes bacterium]|nr:anthranilate phosphoribosyltransferase [Planctomycetota bacterium]